MLLGLINSTTADVVIKEDIGEHAIQGMIDRYIDFEDTWEEHNNLGVIEMRLVSKKDIEIL